MSRIPRRLRTKTTKPDHESLPFYGELAERIAEQRVARNLSQAELAELCGMTQSAVARIERGARPPTIDTLLRVSNALDCELVVDLRPRTKLRKRAVTDG